MGAKKDAHVFAEEYKNNLALRNDVEKALNDLTAKATALKAARDAETGGDQNDLDTMLAEIKAALDTKIASINAALGSTYAEA